MIDFHTHILPRMDDGSRSVEESLEMLDSMRQQGVKTVFATPHFYANDESVDSFLERREASLKAMRRWMKRRTPTKRSIGMSGRWTT